MGKLIVISAPSGSGKTSIVHYLLDKMKELSFSISACSREKREGEKEGEDYYFLALDEFKNNIDNETFLEWQEVYENQFYGTLKSEVNRIWNQGKTVIFDIDVIGGLNIKKQYPKECLTIFIMPPNIDILRKRLTERGTDSNKRIEIRLNKAAEEISKNLHFDKVVVNDNFELACEETMLLIKNFLYS